MILILEGIDKAGKSTVIKDISEKILPNSLVWKFKNKPINSQRDEVNKCFIGYDELFHQAVASHKKVPIVFDRAYPSELVYSIKRQYDAFFDLRFWDLDKRLKDDAKIVYCHAPDEVLKKRFEETGETDLKYSEFPRILERYEQFLSKTAIPVLRVDTTKSREENIEAIKRFIS